MNETTQPILPAAPWYTSDLQVKGVIAGVAQIASILIRWFGLPVSDEQLAMYSADVLQLITIAAGAWAMINRQRSTIAPLTLTRAGAEAKTAANPPMLDVDPTKVTTTQATGVTIKSAQAVTIDAPTINLKGDVVEADTTVKPKSPTP